MIKIGLIGKTNAGKTTFFNAASLASAEVSTYPFTTKQPNVAIAYVQTICACRELDVKDNPRNSSCIDGWRFIPVELIDLPGLIKGSWTGKGLGTQFLSVAAQADALLHVVDASASIDAEGKLTKPGMGNPMIDVYDIEEEIVNWFVKVVDRSLKKIQKQAQKTKGSTEKLLHADLAGLKVNVEHVRLALQQCGLEDKEPTEWSEGDIRSFAKKIRELSKPTMIVANKMDIAYADKNYERLREEFKGTLITPACAEAELALRRAEQKGFIKYIPGQETFKVLDEGKLTKEQSWALNYVQQRVLSRLIRTGVQFALNTCAFKLLGMNVVYPVEDVKGLSDKRKNVLPDALLVPYNATVTSLAREIHTDLARNLLYAIDARSGLRVPSDYVLRDRDIINIVSASKKK